MKKLEKICNRGLTRAVTGKTYTAFQIVYRLLKSGLKKKILYLADRNILVDQSIQQDFSSLQKTIHKIDFAKDDPTTISSYEVYFSQYQQLSGKSESEDEDVYHNLFVQVGMDESLQQSFFQIRCESLSDEDALAYDSSTISVYSENQNNCNCQ